MRVDEGGGHSDEDRGRPWVRSLFFVLAIAAWILFSLRPPEGRAGSEQRGTSSAASSGRPCSRS